MTRHIYPEAAAILRIEETWLRRHIKKLPHSKKGRVVTFSDADLERIDQLTHYEPIHGPLALVTVPGPSATGHPMSRLQPLPQSRRRRVTS